ncbi:MAG TPA: hypothetical protein VJC13_00755 [Candidatus Paceibacterota bacterium]
MSENPSGILIILGIIAIALFGGVKGAGNNGLISMGISTPEQKQQYQTNNQTIDISQQIQNAKTQIDNLKIQLQTAEDAKTQSKYKGQVRISYVNRSNNSSQEYVAIYGSGAGKEAISVSGWALRGLNGGTNTNIPKATILFFAGVPNAEDNIYLSPGETLYLVTGISPNGASFKTNKCSGYLGQFQTFVPYLSSNCPLPRDEDLSSIPKTNSNDGCFDYIDSMPSCRIQTETPTKYLGAECNNFISQKINYSACVNTHRNDSNFYGNEWRIYLKRGQSIWKDRKETIVLYDNEGKMVDSLSY